MPEKGLILYHYYRSSCSYRVRVLLNHKELPYDVQDVHLVKNGGEQNSQDYLVKNPKGEVPLLKDGDFFLSQSMAIFHYLERKFPFKPVFPQKSKFYGLCMQVCEMVNSGIQPIQNLAVGQALKKHYQIKDEHIADWNSMWIEKGLMAIEKIVSRTGGAYCLGDELTAADMFLIPQLYNARRFGVDLTKMPKISVIEKNCLIKESFQKAHPDTYAQQ